MTPRGACFSRAPPFVKRRGSHVHRSLPEPSFFVARPSVEIAHCQPRTRIQARDFQTTLFHAYPKGNTRGSKNPGQADNTPVSKKQARKHTRTRKRIRKANSYNFCRSLVRESGFSGNPVAQSRCKR